MKKHILFLVLAILFCMAGCTNRAPVSDGSAASLDSREITFSHISQDVSGELFFGGLNRDQMALSYIQALPIYKFDTKQELDLFKATYAESLGFDKSSDELPSFLEATAKYDEKFFKNNTLMLVYAHSSTGIENLSVTGVFCDQENYCIYVERSGTPDYTTYNTEYCLITVAEQDRTVANCTYYTAVLNHPAK